MSSEGEPNRGHLESVLDHLPAGIVIAESPSGRIAYQNRRAGELPIGGEELGCAARGEPVVGREVPFHRDDGSEGVLRINAAPIHDGEGKVIMALAIYEDVTELHEARRDAELEGRGTEELLAILSHELRTPLNAILGWTYLLRRPGGTADPAHAVNVVWRNARLLMRAIDDLLDVSRMATGSRLIGAQVIDLRLAVGAAVDAARTAVDEKRQVLRAELGADALPVRGDPARLQRLVGNLLHDAIELTPEGGRVSAELHRDGAEAVLSVEDGREGITGELHGGLGLGLTIVRHLAELHGGRVHAENLAEGGACLRVTLPLAATLDAAELSLPPTAAHGPSLAGHLVLVVDDERDAREVIGAILEAHGAEVVIAADGAEALALAASREPALVVSDIGMPHLDGYQLIRLLRAHGYGGPAVALTAYVAEDVRRRSLEAGYQALLGKPCEPGDLVRVAALLAGSEAVKRQPEFKGEILDLVFDTLPVCVLEGPQHVISLVNDTYTRLFPRPLLGRPFREAFPELVESEVFWILDDVFATGEPANAGEIPASRTLRDGSEREAFISFVIEPLRGPDGRISGLLAVGTDVSAQVAARRRVEALERRSAFLAEASATLASSLEPGETLATVAHLVVHHFADWCTVDLVGAGADDALGPGTVAAADPDLEDVLAEAQRRYPPRASLEDLAGRALQLGQPVLCANCAKDQFAAPRDARHRVLLERMAPRSALSVPLRARGQTLGVMTLAWSRTDRTYTAEDVALADEFARHAAVAVDNALLYREAQGGIRVREEFLSIAGHELKTPLTALKLNLQSLERSAHKEPSPPLGQLADRITKMTWQLARLERLMNELLDVSRVTSGRLKLEPERLDLRELVREILVRAEDDVAESGSQVSLEAPDPVIGIWDPARLDQVVTNLISNAVKYGLGRPIDVTLTSDGTSARLAVRDRGIGISPDEQSRIFGRFERAVSDRHYGGFGLGLWIVRQIVEASAGVVHFESEADHGTTFIVELPLSPPVT